MEIKRHLHLPPLLAMNSFFLFGPRAAGKTTPIYPGFTGQVTLELSNVANLPIAIYPEMKIGQISFYQMTTAAEHPYGSAALGSKYQGQSGPTASRMHEDFTEGDDGQT